MMNCREWERRLDDFVDGRLSAEDRARAEEHLRTCPECAELYEVVKRNRDVLSIADDEALTKRILSATAGSPCDRAHELLLALGDGDEPDAADRELLALHMRHCRPCAVLAADLAWLAETLPAMAEIEPDAAFAADVLAATTERDAAAAAPLPNRFESAWRSLKERLNRLYRRPRFSLEAAYVSLVLLVLLCGTPVSPLKDAPPKALAVVKAAPGELIATAGPDLELAAETAARRGRVLWAHTGQAAANSVRRLGANLEDRGRRTAPALTDAGTHADELSAAVRDLNFTGVSLGIESLGRDLLNAWRLWWTAPEAREPGTPAGDEQN